VSGSVVDPHHIYADPDPDPACHFDPDPEPTFHFDADPDPEPSFQIKAQNLGNVFIWAHIAYILTCHLQIDAGPDPAYQFDADPDPDPAYLFDADPEPDPNVQFYADPDPQHWCQVSEVCGRQNDLLMKMRVLCN
jgi:hypothetical protein